VHKIKKFIVDHISSNTLEYLVLIMKYKRVNNLFSTLMFVVKVLFNAYLPSEKDIRGRQYRNLFNKVKIKISDSDYFIYNIDVYKRVANDGVRLENTSIDYSLVLDNSLDDFLRQCNKFKKSSYKDNQQELLLGICEYIDRLCVYIEKSNRDDKEKLINYFEGIKSRKCENFEEAIQRILFFNQLLWQSGHNLNGLGRLDKILGKYYLKDIESGIITREEALDMIKNMLQILHQNYWFKSNSLMGDTGQIIILGGKNVDGTYFYNDLTELFIEAIKDLKIPDPKLLLRVSQEMPRELMEKSLECIKTGVGCPLFSNDDMVIPRLIKYGYREEDAYNYVTAACWEPCVVSRFMEQCNIDSFVYMKPFITMFDTEDITKISNYDILMNKYKKYLKEYIFDFLDDINKIKWELDPILSLFNSSCNKEQKDISVLKSKNNYYGFTSVSLGNVVNSLYNLKKFVFDEKKYTLDELNEIRKNNFEGKEDVLAELKKQAIRYGTENDSVINIANEITDFVSDLLASKHNSLGGKFKFGLSSPNYIVKSFGIPASFDGRRDNDPFLVHISSDKEGVAYTELIKFASKLKYDDNRINGNVIDFMITPTLIEDNFDKIVDFLMISIDIGFYQMQMNVISSDILIDAKNNPRKYPNLIVRVWGFSAYFNDLPNNYKDLLIERALKNEGKSN